MSKVKMDQPANVIIPQSPTKQVGKPTSVYVVVTLDGTTRSSVATIKKDMNLAVQRDLKLLKKFGLATTD